MTGQKESLSKRPVSSIEESLSESDEKLEVNLNRLLKRTSFFTIIFCIMAFLCMIPVMAAHTGKVNMNNAGGQAAKNAQIQDTLPVTIHKKSLMPTKDSAGITIPLPQQTLKENTKVVKRYDLQQLWVYIDNGKNLYTEDFKIKTSSQVVEAYCYDAEEIKKAAAGRAANGSQELVKVIAKNIPDNFNEAVCIILQLDKVYETDTLFSEGELTMSLKKPTDIYDKIIVIDPAISKTPLLNGEGTTNKEVKEDIPLEIAQKVKEILEKEKIHVYLCRIDEVDHTAKVKENFVSSLNPNYLLTIGNGEKLCAYYNGEIYLRKEGSDMFAEQMSADIAYLFGEEKAEVATYESINNLIEQDASLEFILRYSSHIQNPSAFLSLPSEEIIDGDESLDSYAIAICRAFKYMFRQ